MADSGDNPELKREVALLSWIQQFAPYGVVTLDKSFCVQSWNHWMANHSALSFDQVAGKNLFDLFPILREQKLAAPFKRALAGESSVLSTALHRYLLPLPSLLEQVGDAHMRQTARIAPLLSDQKVCGIVIVIEDVTQREIQAEILSRQHRRDELLSWTLGHLLKAEEPSKTIRQLFFKVAEHLDFDTFFLYIKNIKTEVLSLYAAGGISSQLELEFASYPLLAGAAKAQDIVIFDSVQTRHEPEFDILKKAGVSAAIAIPLYANDRLLGLLCFATASRDSIAPDESDLLKIIAQYLAVAVDRENTSQELQRAREQLLNHAKLLEEQVEARTSQLQETISELETFSYTLAHDLKAPVRGMIGYCEALLEDFGPVLPPNAAHLIQKMARTPKRMEALIKNLLEFSKISRQEIALSQVEIEPLIENVLILRLPAVREATTIVTPLHPVRAHAALLQQVLSNLVDNAVKFIAPKTVPRIGIYTEVVSHTSQSTRAQPLLFSSTESAVSGAPSAPLATEPKRIRIWVVDQGIGIPAGVHQKIFGIFERAVTTETFEGTGMGLAIVARATQRMGGTFGVESELNSGSRFWIELPAG